MHCDVFVVKTRTTRVLTLRVVAFFCAVKGGERAVIFNRVVGVKQQTTGEGTHFMLPWFDKPIIFEVRTRPRQIQSLTGSKGSRSPFLSTLFSGKFT